MLHCTEVSLQSDVMDHELPRGNLLARTVGRRLSQVSGQEVMVENKPGANTQIGAASFAESAPDSYTLTVTSDPAGSSIRFYSQDQAR